MESAGLVADALGRVRDMVRDALKDLSAQERKKKKKKPAAIMAVRTALVQAGLRAVALILVVPATVAVH